MRLPEVTSVPAAVVPPVVQAITPGPSNVVSLSDRGAAGAASRRTDDGARSIARSLRRGAGPVPICCQAVAPAARVETVTAPQPAQFVAVLQRDGGSPAVIMTLDTTTKEFTVRKAGADAPAGRPTNCWMVKPLQRAALARHHQRDRLRGNRACRVRQPDDPWSDLCGLVEPEGGSPTGAPTTPPIMTGKLIETVPAASTPPAKR